MANRGSRTAVLEGLNDYSELLEAEVLPGLVVAIAAQEPAWMREAARERWEGWDEDWAYLDWKMERDWAIAETEFDAAMFRMDDDGGPVTRDWWSYHWGLED